MRHRYLMLFLGLAGASSTLSHAQALPAAKRAITLQAGAAFTIANPDYGTAWDKGISGYASADATHLGVLLEYHNADIITPHDVGEVSYLAGVRYRLLNRGIQPYVKVLAGVGQVKLDQGYYLDAQTSTNFLYAFGGGVDVVATRHIMVRAVDFEFQKWPNFTPHTLSPYVITVGAAYRF